ncbi:MAG TPA: helix-turn-helix transcriptional regulator [Ramlibacter sp.]|jgi:AraC-like DNA-binding protein|uniref:helix-turn-helix transcriptional regulator n=1 Tax=Ramlibacter sp. TaxID=1917967 RepID=UPI002D612BF2|nr:helix-turn-helix transcriptional regulator [Ramlibacter sp.]HZY19526.1 helix-turn-helix transcriptional regulator [Ramlibacter sp.]
MNTAVRTLLRRTGVGLHANVVQRHSLRFSRLAIDSPALILLRHGEKSLSAGTRRWKVRRDEALVVAAGQNLDVENRLSADGLFEARWIVWDAALLAQAAPLLSNGNALADVAILREVPRGLADAIDQAIEAIGNVPGVPERVAAHRMVELLLWLAEQGVRLSGGAAVSTTAKLRGLIAGKPNNPWTVDAAARELATSEATLRRRLAVEGTGFTAVLTDARLSLALTLLQSTDRPISEIASEVGYASASRFAIRFRNRYGFAPSVIRGHDR